MASDTPEPRLPAPRRARLIKAATYASVSVAFTLALAKAWAWQATDSISLLSSLADSVLDLLASCLTFWAVRFSLAPKDREHRFGHGKSEGLAALVQSVIIMGSGGYVLVEAVRRFIEPQPVTSPELGLGVMVGALAATVALVLFQGHVARRTGSVAISADGMHYKTDVAVNLGVLGSLLVAGWTDWWVVDPLVGLAVAGYIIYCATDIFGRAMDILLDREIADGDREKIKAIARAHPDVRGLHDMKTRFGGSHYIVQFHLELSPQLSLARSHEILDQVEDAITERFPDCEIIIHPDPVGFPEKREEYR